MMKVNGKEQKVSSEMTLKGFLEQQQYHLEKIAVERNGEIVPKGEYNNVVLSDTDVLEIVSFVGGG